MKRLFERQIVARAPKRRRCRYEALEPRHLLAAEPLITEFLASNDNTLDDEDGDSSDWVEIHNAGDTALDLDGWYLTDDASDLTQWQFPAVSIDPGQYLVVFASEKDRADDDGTELHTNFRLSANGEYLALVEANGTSVAFEFSPQFPTQTTDVSYGLVQQATQTTLIEPGDNASFIVPSGPIAEWNSLSFDDSSWPTGPTALGHEQTGSNYAGHIETTLPSNTASVYMRQTFSITDPSAIQSLSLGLRYDDGFLAYLNGMLVASDNEPASPQFNSIATGNHPDSEAVDFAPFDLTPFLDHLVAGENLLAIQGMNRGTTNSDMLLEATLTATELAGGGIGPTSFMVQPTPGSINLATGPLITAVTEDPPQPTASQDLVIEAAVHDNAGNGIDRVELHYRIDFGSEMTLQMLDDGLASDAVAGDGVFTATVGSGLYSAGEMVRWYVRADDSNSLQSRAPLIVDDQGQDQDPEYFGTVVIDPSVVSNLPVLQWFVEDPSAAETSAGTRASIYFDGQFYDDVFVRRRGNSTASLAKKSFKIEFNKGHDFVWEAGQAGVNEINLNTTFTDKSYLRQPLAYEFYDLAGAPAPESQLWRVEQNGAFFSITAFTEQVDEDFLEREALDPDGALYKMFNGFTSGTSGVEKKTRLEEDNSDLTMFVNNINNLSGQALTDYIFDNIDIPTTLNYLATTALIQHSDSMRKNYYLYRDSDGTGEWTFIPWDVDLSLGRHFMDADSILGDQIWADKDNILAGAAQNRLISPSHPFVGEQEHPGNRSWNRLIDALYETPEFVELYLRRLRTLMDEILGAPGTPAQDLVLENRIAEIATQIGSDAVLDVNAWGQYGQQQTLQEAIDLIVDDYLAVRREHYFVNHSVNNPSFPDNAGIPDAQIAAPQITIGTIEFAPLESQAREYIEIINANAFAVDISGWTVEGAITHTFKPGTVIAAGTTLYITPSAEAFRNRPTGPSGGQGLLVQQWDSGSLSSFGETITVKRTDGSIVDSVAYPGNPSPEQLHLRVTELHFNPLGPDAIEQAAGFVDGDQFEFLELMNVSTTETLDLNGVAISNGVTAEFIGFSPLGPGEVALVVSDLAAFTQRYGQQVVDGAAAIVQYTADLFSNGGETVKLDDADGSTIIEFRYEDGADPGEEDWHTAADGAGPSLQVVDTSGDYNNGNNWAVSAQVHGTPGTNSVFLAADFEPDGDVDAADLLLWQAGFGTSGDALRSDGDADSDGDVDGADFLAWQRNFGVAAPIVVDSSSGADVIAPLASPLDSSLAVVRSEEIVHTTSTMPFVDLEAYSSFSPASLSRAELADLALAVAMELVNPADDDQTLVVFDDQVLLGPEYARESSAASQSPLSGNTAKSDLSEATQVEANAGNPPWLTEELLERVFI